jgi:hypothetical protein
MKRYNWGWRIITAFAVFTLGTSTWVAYAMSTEVQLVRADYYEAGLHEDQTVAAQQRALKSGATIDYDAVARLVRISIPNGQQSEGTVTLFRPSDEHADRHYALKLDQNGVMQIPVSDLSSGLWHVTLDWKSNGVAYQLPKTYTF